MNPSYTLNGYQRGEIDGAHIRYCPTPPRSKWNTGTS